MEESITLKDFLGFYKKTMEMGPVDAGTYSPLVLAYIGDAVYEVMIRAKVINKGSIQVNKLHKRSAELVKAGTQAAMIRLLEEDLTEEEKQEENLNIRNGLNYARKVLITQECDMLILDEILGAMEYGIISEAEVIALIEAKHEDIELIMTGNMITEAVKEAADRVVSLEVIK